MPQGPEITNKELRNLCEWMHGEDEYCSMCDGIKKGIAHEKNRLNGRASIKKIKGVVLKWAKEQEAIDKFGEITLCQETNDLDEIAKAVSKMIKEG